MKKLAAKLATVLLAPQLRPLEARVARVVGLAILAWLGVKYG